MTKFKGLEKGSLVVEPGVSQISGEPTKDVIPRTNFRSALNA